MGLLVKHDQIGWGSGKSGSQAASADLRDPAGTRQLIGERPVFKVMVRL